jgi:glutamate transport system permease protein
MSRSTVIYDAPGPRARLRNRVITVITVLAAVGIVAVALAKLGAKGQLAAAKWEPFTTANLWRTYILPGAEGTLTAAALSIALALALGVALAVGRMSSGAPIRWLCAAVVEFLRAVPVLIMMIFAYFIYALHDVFPATQLALAGVVTGLTLYNAAVIAEIVRAGVHALPRGQSEAAAALGLRRSQTMRLILLPQAITAMLPALVSQLVVVLKDTAIGYQITFVEMVRQGTVVGSQYGNYLPALLVIAALMITVNATLSGLAVRLEARLRRSRRSAVATAPAAAQAAQIDVPGTAATASNTVAGEVATGQIRPA